MNLIVSIIVVMLFCTSCGNVNDNLNVNVNEELMQSQDLKVYGTDIVTYLNGYTIPCVVMNDEVLVFVDDLPHYGFRLEHIKRDTKIFFDEENLPKDMPPIAQENIFAPGEYICDAIETDYSNEKFEKVRMTYGVPIDGYIVQDRLAIPIAKYGDINERSVMVKESSGEVVPYNSKYWFSSIWNEEERILTINSLKKGYKVETELGFVDFDSTYRTRATFEPSVSDIYKGGFMVDWSPLGKLYDLGDLFEDMQISYTMEDGVLTIENIGNTAKEMNVETGEASLAADMGKPPIYDTIKISFRKKENLEEEFIGVFFQGEVYITETDVERLIGIHINSDSKTKGQEIQK